jgi:hypothetical protein
LGVYLGDASEDVVLLLIIPLHLSLLQSAPPTKVIMLVDGPTAI